MLVVVLCKIVDHVFTGKIPQRYNYYVRYLSIPGKRIGLIKTIPGRSTRNIACALHVTFFVNVIFLIPMRLQALQPSIEYAVYTSSGIPYSRNFFLR